MGALSASAAALLLAPIFSEINLPGGIGLKQQIQQLRADVKADVASLRAEITTRLDVRNTFQPQIVLPVPAPDSQLPELEKRVRNAVAEALQEQHVDVPLPPEPEIATDLDTQYLFAARYNIERELRRIVWSRELAPEGGRTLPTIELLRMATDAGLVPAEVARAIREVSIISNRGIHAEPISKAQVQFVRDIAPDIVGALRAIK